MRVAYGHLAPKYLDVGGVPGIMTESPLQRTPSHSFAAALDYEVPLSVGTIEVHGDYGYHSAGRPRARRRGDRNPARDWHGSTSHAGAR